MWVAREGLTKCLYDQCDNVQSRPLGSNVIAAKRDAYNLTTTPIPDFAVKTSSAGTYAKMSTVLSQQ